MNPKLLFFDIDGTLITEDDDHIFPESAKEALRQAKKQGHLVFINTGRVFINLDSFITNIGFDGFVCGCGCYVNLHNEVLYHNTIPHSICREVGFLARECGIYTIFEASDHNAIDFKLPLHPQIERLSKRFAGAGHPITMNVDDDDFCFDKFTIWFDKNSDIERFKQGISSHFDYIDRGTFFGEIIPKGHTKATGIAKLQKILNVPIENCYVFGDGPNDLSMLRYVPNSICMGNGSPAVKSEVSFVTTSVMDNGIMNAMKHFELI